MIYQWKAGFPTRGADAQAVGEKLETIREQTGGILVPADVVQAARAERSPLHGFFEWDDSVAAEEYRILQAKDVIRAVVVTIAERPEAPPVRAFVSVRQTEETTRTYTSTIAAMEDPELRAQVLATAQAELAAWRRKYNGLHELAEVFAVVDAKVLATV